MGTDMRVPAGQRRVVGGSDISHHPQPETQVPRGRPRKQPSIAELKSLLNQQRRNRVLLLNERKKLQNRLDQIDRQISMLDGGNGAAGGGRGRNTAPLPDVIEAVLKKSSKPMRVGDIVNAVQQAGYRSSSANFRGIVNQALIKEKKRFQSPSRGLYTSR